MEQFVQALTDLFNKIWALIKDILKSSGVIKDEDEEAAA